MGGSSGQRVDDPIVLSTNGFGVELVEDRVQQGAHGQDAFRVIAIRLVV